MSSQSTTSAFITKAEKQQQQQSEKTSKHEKQDSNPANEGQQNQNSQKQQKQNNRRPSQGSNSGTEPKEKEGNKGKEVDGKGKQGKPQKEGQQAVGENRPPLDKGNKNKDTHTYGGRTGPVATKSINRFALFDHLPQKFNPNSPDSIDPDISIHPAIIKLGGIYSTGIIYEDDDRACALLVAFCNVIQDYIVPTNKNIIWDLDKHIKAQVQYLVNCRPHSVAMGNIIKFLRTAISNLPQDWNEKQIKSKLIADLKHFLTVKILLARESIAQLCHSVIKEDDVILTFGSSPVIRQVLTTIAKTKKFKLIVVDSFPLKEGVRTLTALSPLIKCVYVPMSGAANVMRDATRVIMGASSLLSNGTLLAPVGTGMIACLAKARRIPVIFAVETYKFSEKVQLDSIVNNELGNQLEIVRPETAAEKAIRESEKPDVKGDQSASVDTVYVPQDNIGYRGGALDMSIDHSSIPYQVLNLRYDLTSMRNISVIATETGLLPPTSIPVVIRGCAS